MAWSEIVQINFKKTPYEFHLHGLCDLQLGSESTSLSVIRSRIHEIVSDPHDCGIIIPGDIEDEDRQSTRSLRRSAFSDRGEVNKRDAEKHRDWLDDKVIPMLMPLQTNTSHGILGILAGHHWTQLSPVQNSVQYMCQEISRLSGKKVPYLGEMLSYLDLRFHCGNKGFRKLGLIMHGEGGGQTQASTIQKLERAAQGFEGDFFIRGHDCQLLATKRDKLYPKELKNKHNMPEMMSRTIVYLNLGAATRGYNMQVDHEPDYVEHSLMRPTTMGWGTLKFRLRRAYRWEDRSHSIKCAMTVEI